MAPALPFREWYGASAFKITSPGEKTVVINNYLILIKHALPFLNPETPAREWALGKEGKKQSVQLSCNLASRLPFQLFSSPEVKAEQTANIIANNLGMEYSVQQGLQEFDRPVLPIMSKKEHIRINQQIFDKRDVPVLGEESANKALARFDQAVNALVALQKTETTIAFVTHGTVISLFVEKYNPISGFDLWKNLQCGSFVVLSLADFHWDRSVYHLS